MAASFHNVRNLGRQAIAALLVMLPAAAPAAVEAELELRPRLLELGETAELTVTVRGTENPRPPPIKPIRGLKISGPQSSQSTQISIVNGRRQRDSFTRYTYHLLAVSTGEFTIGPFTYQVDGRLIELPRQRFTVVESGVRRGDETADSASPPAIFARLETEEDEIMVQQPFELRFKLYTRRIELSGPIEVRGLEFDGLRVNRPRELEPRREEIDGRVYNVRRFNMTCRAISAGKYRLEPTIRVNVITTGEQRRGRDPFQSFFDTRSIFRHETTRPVDLPVEPLELSAIPLPPEDQPAWFTGAVGKFDFEAQVEPRQLAAGDVLTVTMRISGRGNIDQVTPPPLDFGDGFRVYEPELTQEEIDLHRSGGERTFEQAVIARDMDSTPLPLIRFAYFDTARREYRTISRGPWPLDLEPAPRHPDDIARTRRPDADRVLGTDIVYLKDAPRAWPPPDHISWWRTAGGWLPHLAPPLAAGLLWLLLGVHERRSRDEARARRYRAPRSARRGLRQAQRALERQDIDALHESLWRAMIAYFGHRLNLPPGAVTSADVLQRLQNSRLDEKSLQIISATFEDCEAYRFAGKRSSTDDETLQRERIAQLSRALRACDQARL